MCRNFRRRRKGQALPTMALFAVAIFAIVGFAIDAGLLYMQRRLMQNTADAACLASANQLALNKTSSAATNTAQLIVEKNLGLTPGAEVNAPGSLAYATVSDIYSPQIGSGITLGKGIEINGSDVRVALQSPANAFFLRIVGYNTYTVAARAHCDAKAGGGGTPFAVARWRGYDSTTDNVDDINTDSLTTNKTLPQYYSQGNTSKKMTVRDMLSPVTQSIISNWPGWGAADYPGDAATGTDLYSSPATPASQASPGPETYIAGQGAQPNVGDNSFFGPIVMDFRQTTFPSPLFYNGLTPSTALNQYKNFTTKYILGSYPGPLVLPGQQIGYYNGASAGQVIKPFDQRYNKDDIVAVLMYNGTIYSDPDFTVTFPAAANSTATRSAGTFTLGSPTCSVPSGEVFDGQTANQTQRKPDASYKLNLLPDTYSTFRLRAFISSNDPNKWQGSWNGGSQQTFNINGSASLVSIDTSGKDLAFTAHPTREFSCVDALTGVSTTYPSRKNGAQTIYLEAQDTATSKRRAVYVFLNQNADANDFYAYFSDVPVMYQPLEPGKTTSATLKLIKAGNNSSLDLGTGASKVQAGAIEWYEPADLNSVLATGTSLNGVTVSVGKQGSSNLLSVATSNSATTGKEYYLRIPLTYSGYTHYVWYYIAVRTAMSNASGISQFVYALGYANFKITEVGANYIKGRAVSGLMGKSTDIIAGFQPRLKAWQ